MSHIVSVKTEIRDAAAVQAACQRLGLGPPLRSKTKLFAARREAWPCKCPTGYIVISD
jgi:hypothetical protein